MLMLRMISMLILMMFISKLLFQFGQQIPWSIVPLTNNSDIFWCRNHHHIAYFCKNRSVLTYLTCSKSSIKSSTGGSGLQKLLKQINNSLWPGHVRWLSKHQSQQVCLLYSAILACYWRSLIRALFETRSLGSGSPIAAHGNSDNEPMDRGRPCLQYKKIPKKNITIMFSMCRSVCRWG